jgi:hypothetical protein
MRPIVLLLGATLALAACGGGDDGRLSADEYRKRANELCADASREASNLNPPTSPEGFADYLEEALDLTRTYETRFKELEPPDELNDLHQSAVRLNAEFEKDFKRLIERVRAAANPIAEFQRSLQRLLPAIQRGDTINRKLKLDECLQSPALRGTPGGPA